METNEPKKRRGRPRKNLNVETINNVETNSNEQIGTLNNVNDDIEEVPPIKENKKIIKKVIKKEEQKEKSFFEKLYNL